MVERIAHGDAGSGGLRPYLSQGAAWSLALGTAIGWGSFVITGNSLLLHAGPAGSVLGLLVGFAVMLVIARNYHYLMCRYQDAGGVYAYAGGVLGHDYGFLSSWFLGLTYAAMLWANATALPLFVRYALGGLLKLGFSYHVFGYEVYLGEAVLSALAIVVAGLICVRGGKAVSTVMVGLAVTFTAAIVVCFGVAMARHGETSFSFQPIILDGEAPWLQVLRVACMAPWAFIGFESISHASEEFSFSELRSFRVMTAALVTATLLYVFVTLLSATAYPAGYDSWLAYLSDLPNIETFERYPVLFAAWHYLGNAGMLLLLVALLALIVSSLVGNILALSRLLYALARDGLLAKNLCALNGNGVPERAIMLVALVSCAVPFMGRTAIGWVVDVTTLGATLTYAMVSVAACKQAREDGDTLEVWTGAIGAACTSALGLLLLLPNTVVSESMATESYFLFTVWAILGFVCFRAVLRADREQRFGRSVVVWIGLLSLVVFSSLTWMNASLGHKAETMVGEVQAYYCGQGPAETEEDFLAGITNELHTSLARNVSQVAGLFLFSMGVMLSNFSIIQKRSEENVLQLGVARAIANTDSLTGVKSKHAYAAKEAELNYRIEEGDVQPFAVVVCDVNGLKQVNDTMGHKAGDEYIRAASMLICHLFKHSPVYRIGGDEFAVVMTGSDYGIRDELVASLDRQSQSNQRSGEVVVAAGMSEYQPGKDEAVAAVFERADALMYQRKKELKALA